VAAAVGFVAPLPMGTAFKGITTVGKVSVRVEKTRKAMSLRNNAQSVDRLARRAAKQASEKSRKVHDTLVELGWAAAWQGMKMIGQEIVEDVEKEVLAMEGECGGYHISVSQSYEQQGYAVLEYIDGKPVIIYPPGEEYVPID
jgi:hypothetical protein